jgi:hypothetical protein
MARRRALVLTLLRGHVLHQPPLPPEHVTPIRRPRRQYAPWPERIEARDGARTLNPQQAARTAAV